MDEANLDKSSTGARNTCAFRARKLLAFAPGYAGATAAQKDQMEAMLAGTIDAI